MKIVENYSGNYPDDIVTHFGLSKLNYNLDNTVLFNGIKCCINNNMREIVEMEWEKIYINTEFPCSFLTTSYNTIENHKYFDKVLSICPYTNEWLNSMIGLKTKFIDMPFPYDDSLFKKYDGVNEENKEYDVIYYGQVHSPQYYEMIDVITRYKYKYLTPSYQSLNQNLKSKITNYNVTTFNKWDILSKCKISVGINLLFINQSHKNAIKRYTDWNKNIAFNKLNENIMPQFKTRMIEAALCKTLMLIKKDSWNVIEYWFEPNVDFLYWENVKDLNVKINDIINNYDKYLNIIENAHNKVKNYSIKNILKTNL